MRIQFLQLILTLCAMTLVAIGCNGNEDDNTSEDTDTATDSESSSDSQATGQVDLLVVLDNSSSMEAEHLLLSQSLTALANLLSAPIDGKPSPVESLRMAVITSDMGLQWNGSPPDTDAIDAGEKCDDDLLGDNGLFIATPGDAATAAATIDALGTEGCGFEQPLVAAAVGLENEEQANAFLRPDALLAILFVSDEDDCSLKEALPPLYGLTCGHTSLLFAPTELRDRLLAVKTRVSGNADDVIFAAIVGVPAVDACQGAGADIADCLDQETMGLNPDTDPDSPVYMWDFACQRQEENGDNATEATPGVRFVETAQLFGNAGYTYSICNADWTPAMNDIAALISSQFAN